MNSMTVGMIKERLSEFNEDDEVVVFANGDVYPVLQVQYFEGDVEIGCGHQTIREDG